MVHISSIIILAVVNCLFFLSIHESVTVSLLTIQGTNCRTANLGQVADKTRGECISVDPLSITKEVSDILSNPVIATNVKAKIILHKKL